MINGHDEPGDNLYGLLSEYETADQLVDAANKAREAGYKQMDGYSPYPVPGVADAIKFPFSEMAIVMFLGGIIGCISGFMMQYYTSVIDYPLNVGGRPLNSWPSFIPVTFEMTILTTGLSGVFGLMVLCGLPQPHHPLFNVPAFERASQDRFFLCIEATDKKFDKDEVAAFLNSTQPLSVTEVPIEQPEDDE